MPSIARREKKATGEQVFVEDAAPGLVGVNDAAIAADGEDEVCFRSFFPSSFY
jgi:hypothetical protein